MELQEDFMGPVTSENDAQQTFDTSSEAQPGSAGADLFPSSVAWFESERGLVRLR
jgi:hypothetical protein